VENFLRTSFTTANDHISFLDNKVQRVYLPALGFCKPFDQYVLIGVSIYALSKAWSFTRKAFFVHTYLHDTDHLVKAVCKYRSGLSQQPLSPELYQQRLGVIARRYCYIPIAFVALGLVKKRFDSEREKGNA
jgi:hypothetical protein